MISKIQFKGKEFQVDLSKALDISIPLRKGTENPNCYWAEAVRFETIKADNFIGSVALGGSVNYQKVTLTPHGNGTHTECYGHITADTEATIDRCLQRFHFRSALISVSPEDRGGDRVITKERLTAQLQGELPEAIIIRTLPNPSSKAVRRYSGTNPPYMDADAVAFLVENHVQHLLIDLPSLDKEVDEGRLSAHKVFWGIPGNLRKQCTVTELIYVPEHILDGEYLLNLQITGLQMDASPSKPILYKILHQ